MLACEQVALPFCCRILAGFRSCYPDLSRVGRVGLVKTVLVSSFDVLGWAGSHVWIVFVGTYVSVVPRSIVV